MKKTVLMTLLALGVVGCTTTQAPSEDAGLKQAYSKCINTAEGNPDKIKSCQSVLDVLRQDKQHQAFVEKETISSSQYQDCIQARKEGNDQLVQKDCDKIWQEIRANNQ